MKKLKFVSYYTKMGSIKGSDDKLGLVIKDTQTTKEFQSLLYFKLDDENFERKISKKDLNKIRDFGTSVYGLFEVEENENSEIFKKDTIIKILEVLNQRIETTLKDIEIINNLYIKDN